MVSRNHNYAKIWGYLLVVQPLYDDILEPWLVDLVPHVKSPRHRMIEHIQNLVLNFPRNTSRLAHIRVYEQAEKYFLESLKLDSEYARSYDALGILHGVQGQQAKALKYHRKAVELQADNPKFWHNYGFAKP